MPRNVQLHWLQYKFYTNYRETVDIFYFKAWIIMSINILIIIILK